MSHFCVLVIGSDVEEQLAKYDENESVEEYRRRDVSEEDKNQTDYPLWMWKHWNLLLDRQGLLL